MTTATRTRRYRHWYVYTPAEIASWEPQSAGNMECPACRTGHAEWDALDLTPAGICVRCSASSERPVAATPQSDPFWTLTPEEIARLDGELYRLHTAAVRLEKAIDWSSPYEFNETEQATEDKLDQINREIHLLLLLRESSRQFRAGAPMTR